jgi:predicted RNA-binding protein
VCESAVFLVDGDVTREVMKEVTRIVMRGHDVVCTDIVGEQVIIENVVFSEANLLSHGIVFKKRV